MKCLVLFEGTEVSTHEGKKKNLSAKKGALQIFFFSILDSEDLKPAATVPRLLRSLASRWRFIFLFIYLILFFSAKMLSNVPN